jgi:hypothetical protein
MARKESGAVDGATAVIFAGAALAALGAFLPWAKVTAGTATIAPKGINGWEGKTILILAVGMAVRGALGARGRRPLAILVILGGLIIAGIAGYTMATVRTDLINAAANEIKGQFGGSVAVARDALEKAFTMGLLKITFAPGIYLPIIGGLMGAVGGAIAAFGQPASAATSASTNQSMPDRSDAWASAQEPWVAGSQSTPRSAPEQRGGDPRESAPQWSTIATRDGPSSRPPDRGPSEQDREEDQGRTMWSTIAVPPRPAVAPPDADAAPPAGSA